MKVHITLVGGQPAPVYNGIVATQPDKIVFIYSEESRDIAKRISDEVKIPSERWKMDPVDLNDIEKKVAQCAEKYKDDEVSVNISSGTKPWAFYFAKFFGAMPNATLFYVDQNNMLWNLSDKTARKVDFDMDVQFRLLGNPLQKYTRFEDYDEKDIETLEELKKMFVFDSGQMFRLINECKTKTHTKEHFLKNGSSQIQQINATLFVEKGVRKPLKLQRRKSKKCDFSLFAKKCLSLRSFQKTKRWSI